MKTILIIDDVESIRLIATMVLEREGFRIVEAADGLQALQCLQEQAIDLVVTDMHMPQMNGLDLISNINASYRLPVIGMSATSHQDAFRAVGALFLDKALLHPELVIMVKQLLA